MQSRYEQSQYNVQSTIKSREIGQLPILLSVVKI